MKKRLLSVMALVLAGSTWAHSQSMLSLPEDKRSNPIATHMYGGYSSTRLNSAGEVLVCSGRCLLAAVIQSTGANGNWWRARDTGTADSGNAAFTIGPVEFATINTAPGKNAVALPMLHTNGIAVHLGAVGASEWITVEYIKLPSVP